MYFVRCTQGHVFDRKDGACPVCGEGAVAEKLAQSKPIELKAAPPTWLAKNWPLAGGALGAFALAAWSVMSPTPHMPPASEAGKEATPAAQASVPTEALKEVPSAAPDPRPEGITKDVAASAKPSVDAGGEEDLSPLAKGTQDPNLTKAEDHPEIPDVEYPFPSVQEARASIKLTDLVVDMEVFAAVEAATRSHTTPWHVAVLLKLGDRGISSAKYLASIAFLNGTGVSRDAARGLKLLEEAALAGQPSACLMFGRLLYQGETVPKDIERAKEFILRAARTPVPGAEQELGRVGLTRKDVGPTAEDVRGHANDGDKVAIKLSRDLIANKVVAGAVPFVVYAYTHSKDYALRREAVEALPSAVQAGIVAAMSAMVGVHSDGSVVVQNASEALIWAERYRSACGDAYVCTTLDRAAEILREQANVKEIKRIRDAIRNELDPPVIDMQ